MVLIVDDAQPGFISYSGSQWTHSIRNSNYNRTITECQVGAPSPTTLPPSLSFSFYGTAINFYGGPITSNTAFNYSLDSQLSQTADINPSAIGKIGAAIWSLTGLSAGTDHFLKVIPVAGLFSLDYITFTPTTLESTSNLDVILDDDDFSLQYTGTWLSSSTAPPGGFSYGGTMKGSSTEGSSMKFQLEVGNVGTSISVNGLLNQVPGSLSASFSVDGGKVTTFSPFNGSQQTNASSWAFSQQFFHQDLSPGEHTLLVTVEQATESQVLWIDSVVYGATDGTSTSTGSSGSGSSGLGALPKKIIGIAAGVFGFMIFLRILQRRWLRNKNRPQVVPPVVQEQPPTFLQPQEMRVPQHQPQPNYSPMPPLSHLPGRDTYPRTPTETYTINIATPPSPQNYYQPSADRAPTGRTTYPPRQDGDGLDFPNASQARSEDYRSKPYTPRQDGDGLDFPIASPARNENSRYTPYAPRQDGDGLDFPIASPARNENSRYTPYAPRQDGDGLDFPTSHNAPGGTRASSPPQQDGSDGVQQQQESSALLGRDQISSQLDGSESLAHLNPYTTVLTYHHQSTPQPQPSHTDGLRERQPLSHISEENEDPPAYNPYE